MIRCLDPVQKRIAGGCHFTRPIVDLLRTSGLAIAELDVFYEGGAPKFLVRYPSASPCLPSIARRLEPAVSRGRVAEVSRSRILD